MSDLSRIAQDAIEVAFGSGARVHLRHVREGYAVAWVEDGVRAVLAVAGGATGADAWRMLIQQCYRDDHRPTTSEAATVLGVSDSRVRQLVQAGTLVPDTLGSHRHEARFKAGDVWTLVKALDTAQ